MAAQIAGPCDTCAFWAERSRDGKCHAQPPLAQIGLHFGYWPTTRPGDWCGQWIKAQDDSPEPEPEPQR